MLLVEVGCAKGIDPFLEKLMDVAMTTTSRDFWEHLLGGVGGCCVGQGREGKGWGVGQGREGEGTWRQIGNVHNCKFFILERYFLIHTT